MNKSANWIVGLLILTPVAILAIVVIGAIKFSDYCPGRWKLLSICQNCQSRHRRKSSDTSSDSTKTNPLVDLESGPRTGSKRDRNG